MRKLASIQIIKNIEPIDGADKIEVAQVLGWKVVVQKGAYRKGDLCIYFEVDALLPIEDRYSFLESCRKISPISGEGYRIKTRKIRGVYSQGLIMPMKDFPEIDYYEEGADVTEFLRVKKWEEPEVTGSLGVMTGKKPYFVPTTDETRVQSDDELRKACLGKECYISTKMDGTSVSVYYVNGEVGATSRNNSISDTPDSCVWKYLHAHRIPEALKNYGRNLVLQGEFCGEGIQKNRLKLKTPEWYVFNVFFLDEDMHRKMVGLYEMLDVCEELGLKHVPIEEIFTFNMTLDECIARAKGNYKSGNKKEGIVIRPVEPEYSESLKKCLSFKVLNNDYLLKD